MDAFLLQPAPQKLEEAQKQIFSSGAIKFLEDLIQTFKDKIESLYHERLHRKYLVKNGMDFDFPASPERKDTTWKVADLPPRLRCRRLDLGDVSPSNTSHFLDALSADVQGIQVDFDDGHCPSWKNQIQGYYNINRVVLGKLPGAPSTITTCPLLIFRPRAWNIIEHNILINDREVPGAVIDFAIIMYHNAKILFENFCGPYFYLSKLESASEAKLWNQMFEWAQQKLDIPIGTIKACVLIENILSSFAMDEILYALKDHSLGLNCGVWDYSASIISKFGHSKEFLIGDRNKYVNINQTFLKSCYQLVIKTCHLRGAMATGGMVATVLPPNSDGTDEESKDLISNAIMQKVKEIELGVDGFLVYDVRMLPHMNELWKKHCSFSPNQMNVIPNVNVKPADLLTMPNSGVTLSCLRQNVAVTILFIYHWLAGVGHFFYEGKVEDSATAEISRSQVWQWIRHKPPVEDSELIVSYQMVEKIVDTFTTKAHKKFCRSTAEKKRMTAARYMALEVFTAMEFPEFITTLLNDSHKFRTLHNKTLLSFKSSL